MVSHQDYLDYILDQLSSLEEITVRRMMGEYILYYCGRIVGGIYDDRLLVKPVAAAKELLPDAAKEEPYPGARPLLRVDEADDRQFLTALFTAMLPQLPLVKKRGSSSKKQGKKEQDNGQ